jgi:hypothetical protein
MNRQIHISAHRFWPHCKYKATNTTWSLDPPGKKCVGDKSIINKDHLLDTSLKVDVRRQGGWIGFSKRQKKY